MKASHVAIIGGGPAGLYAAWLLCSQGIKCTIFDHRIPWEKPCGGGITSKAFDRFPILAECRQDMQVVKDFTFLSPTDRIAHLRGNAQLHIVPRHRLSEYMLEKALTAGVIHVGEKVTGFTKDGNGFSIVADSTHKSFDFIIGADGAHGVSRNLFGAASFQKNRFAGLGYYVEGLTDNRIVLKSYADLKGYLWMFPRQDHASVGIGFTSGTTTKKEALAKIREFMEKHYPDFQIDEGKSYAATIPYTVDWTPENLQGEGWALIGDAGGFTDAITGEGIYYAFRSAEILAESILDGKPASYFEATRPLRRELEMACRIADRFYQPRTLEWMVTVCKRSAFMRRLIADMILGHESYHNLKPTMKRNKWKVMRQLFWGLFFPYKPKTEDKPAPIAA